MDHRLRVIAASVFLSLLPFVLFGKAPSIDNGRSFPYSTDFDVTGCIIRGRICNRGSESVKQTLQLPECLKNGPWAMEDIAFTHGDNPKVIKDSSKQVMTQQNHDQENLRAVETGRQYLYLKRDPNRPVDGTHDQWLGIFFTGPEWSAIFYDVLGYKGHEPFKVGDDINEWTERHRLHFQQTLSDYPMLARIWHTYIDVTYELSEIGRLRNECLKLKTDLSNEMALSGLNKLIYACDKAIESQMGLFLTAD